MFNTQILAGSSGQGGETQQSLKFNDDESQYLSWTPAAAGSLTTWTWSGWVKRANLGGTQAIFATATTNDVIYFDSNNSLTFYTTGGYYSLPPNVFRDTSAWYHFVFVWDTNNATQADRIRVYLNGERLAFGSGTQAASGATSGFNNNVVHGIGYAPYVNSYFLDGYLSDIYFIDGQALDASSFGQFTNGYWKAKDYAGTYGTNGFHLTFEDDVVSEGFNATTYLATEANQSISGIGFSPDLVIVKNRDSSSNARWGVIDSVRGVNKTLATDITDAEVTSRSDLLTSFDADGFSLGADAAAYGWNNQTYTAGDRQVAWCWDAGSGSAASNTDGSITSTVKANPSYGFSIVSYTGTFAAATVGHGLSSAPELIIVKNRSTTTNWWVGSDALGGWDKYLGLDLTNAVGTVTSIWNGTAPTSTVFSVANDGGSNGSGNSIVAYCFNSVAGYSSIGSYSGTGSSVTVNCGFRPAFIMIKATNLVEGWAIIDGTRDTINPRNKVLKPNSTNAEASGSQFNTDFTDTGFVMNGTDGVVNASGGTYIYMAFADTREAAFWKDVSGQGNNWTPNNLDYRDSLIDSPANNFATWNPVSQQTTSSTFYEGNLKTLIPASAANGKGMPTMGLSSGKWYWEYYYLVSNGNYLYVGITDPSAYTTNSYWIRGSDGETFKYENGSSSGGSATTHRHTQGDIVQVAFDADNGKWYVGTNGTWSLSGNPVAGTGYVHNNIVSGEYGPFAANATSGNSQQAILNTGQDSTFSGARPAGGNQDANNIGDFAYAPPSGYLALCTANLPTPTIVDGSEYFNTVTYTGTGTTNAITGVGFSPDFVWGKQRSGVNSHELYDTVRGVNQVIYSDLTDAEGTNANGISSFDADGYTVAGNTSINLTSASVVAWNWKAGGTAVSNTAGSITSQVSANVDAGFSVLTFNGTGANATVGHGLGVAPSMVIMKQRNNSGFQWPVY